MQLIVIQTPSAQELIKWKEICISTLTLYPVTYKLFVHLDKGDCGEHHSSFFFSDPSSVFKKLYCLYSKSKKVQGLNEVIHSYQSLTENNPPPNLSNAPVRQQLSNRSPGVLAQT